MHAALDAIRSLPSTRVTRVSSLYETEPIGVVDQPAFINAAAEIETDLEPADLLAALKRIETTLERERSSMRWGPRILDIDIILWDDRILDSPALKIPHPEFRHRAFVLIPLAEIAPNALDPITSKSIAFLADSPEAIGEVRVISEPSR